jgi:hypothetical protein
VVLLPAAADWESAGVVVRESIAGVMGERDYGVVLDGVVEMVSAVESGG